MNVREGRFEDLPEAEQIWLRDQHPRGAQIIAEMNARYESQPVVEEDDDVPPYEEWEYKDLQAEAKARGLDASGKKEELVARLNEHDVETES